MLYPNPRIEVRRLAVHPRRSSARVLLTSVFGPYARDDEYGSREINPMELHHNQVTRVQGPFSIRMFHRSWGLMMIQSNLEAPCALLDFPDLDRFIAEIRDNRYDVVGISAIVPNHKKVAKMCELIREHLPDAAIVVGGHVVSIPDIEDRIDADHIVFGEGIRWFREYLGEDAERPIRHPEIVSALGLRCMGLDLGDRRGETSATVVPSVGCPMGCNFCCTSALFGGKGNIVSFYETGDELFDVMEQLERSMGVQSFFVMDENFLLYRRRARRLLDLMRRHDKSWSLSLFSSANALRAYPVEELLDLGLSWLWLGLEGEVCGYEKLRGADTMEIVGKFRSHGIRVLGSTIIGLEHHTPENIDAVIEHAVRHDSDFHQFMLYMPLPGTPLHQEMSDRGRMLDESECDLADIHGQLRFNYRHPRIPAGRETELLLRAFYRDLEVNGPSIARLARTMLNGWRRHRRHPDARVRRRVHRESGPLATTFAAAVRASRMACGGNPALRSKLAALEADLVAEFGWKTRLWARVGGPVLRWTARREERRLSRGWTYEPPTFYEKNAAALALSNGRPASAAMCRSVAARRARPDARPAVALSD